ncbi:MAG: Holliday junction branch migration DNA helicase RuvB [Candidatus Latescibacteria bacterium]|jgi:holliday junction DNA helicase RuvB|nr:Holliday junction branch migration DNA helicase RuvB [Candidatus Latescibacterota bacterium]
MTRERIISGKPISPEEDTFTWSLRPKTLKEYIGQNTVVKKLLISLEASGIRGEPQEHLLLHGPPGLGKTTLAYIVSREMGTRLVTTTGPTLSKIADLMGIMTNLDNRDVLFIDEIHRLPTAVEEFIYPAMEDFRVDFIVDKGPFSKVINVPLKRFTLIGATTRVGLLSAPLRDRFGITYHLDFYSHDEMKEIVVRSAGMLDIKIDKEGADIIASSSRGTPRIANRLLRRARDYAIVKADGNITGEVARKAFDLEGIDSLGLDDLDRILLKVIIDYYKGGPVGIEAVAATLSEEVNTLEEMVEPYLLKIGFLIRTKRGRMVSQEAYKHLGIPFTVSGQASLFA